MSGQPFVIQQVVFDLDFFSKEDAYDLQNRVSRLFSRELANVMQQAFSKTVPEDLLVKGDRILLDIGTVSYENFEKEMVAGLERALIDVFSAFLQQANAGQAQETNTGLSLLPLSKRALSLFENFLFTGALPFYAAGGGMSGLEKTLDGLFDAEPERLASLLSSAGQSEWVRKRLAYQFSEPFMEKIVRLLEPAEARFIIAYKTNVSDLHQRSPVATADAQSFHKELWVFVLTFLLVERGSLFNRKEFAGSTFKKIAAHFGMRYNDLLLFLKESLVAVDAEANKSELITLINLLTTEETTTEINRPAGTKTGQALLHEPEILPLPVSAGEEQSQFSLAIAEERPTEGRSFSSNDLRWLCHYVKYGSLPMDAAVSTRSQLEDLFLVLLREKSEDVHRLFSRFSTAVVQKRSVGLGINYTAERGEAPPFLPLPNGDADAGTFSLTEQPGSLSAQYKEDLLYHFLRTGFLPWWALPQTFSLQSLLEDLYVSSPQKVRELLKWAGREEKCKVRFINRFSPFLFINVVTGLPDGKEAAGAFEKIIRLPGNEDNRPLPTAPFLHLLWNNYILHDYQRFDGDLFFIQAVHQLAGCYNIPAEALQVPLFHLIEKKTIAPLQTAVQRFGTAKKLLVSPSVPFAVSEEELITTVLAGRDENHPIPHGKTAATGAANSLVLALTDHVGYFFRHRSLPHQTQKKTTVSPDLFCKAALLLLYKTAEGEAEKLISRYYDSAALKQLMAGGFDRSDYREKAVLLWLHKLVIRHSGEEHKAFADGIADPSPAFAEGENKTAPAPPLLQPYQTMESHSPMSKAAEARLVLQHFLAWQTLPPTATNVTNASPDNKIREIVFFLFVSDRTGLQSLLQNKTNLPQAVIRMAGLFKEERGGTEALLRIYLQPYVREAALDCLWEENTESNIEADVKHSPLPAIQQDVLTLLHKEVGQSNVQDVEREAGDWLDHFLTYDRLPHTIGQYREEDAVMTVLLFLAERKAPLLPQILEKESHHPVARMKLYEWLQKKESSGRACAFLTEERVRKESLVYLRETSQTLPEGTQNGLPLLRKSSPAAEGQAFLQAVARFPAAREEWVKTLPLTELFGIIKETNPAAAKQYAYVINVLINLVGPVLQQGYERDNFTLHCKAFLLLIVSGTLKVNHPADFIHRFFRYVDNRKPSYVPRLYQNLQRSWSGTVEAMTAEPVIKKEIQKAIAFRLSSPAFSGKAKGDAGKMGPSSTPAQQKGRTSQNIKTTDRATATNLQNTDATQRLTVGRGTKLYVANAGLVLLHPFISTYFTLTGLVQKNEFVNEEARQRAVLLLQYAVFKTAQHEEQTLVLNKLLCGLPLETPVPASLLPTGTEMNITAELFAIIFQRWERMKNASAEGFRQSFLQREGRLIRGEKAWALRIEQRGYDVMLQTLPWAFGVVKLPWMPLAIETEWI